MDDTTRPAPVRADYRPSRVEMVAVFDKLVNGRKVGEVPGPQRLFYQHPDGERPWGDALEDLLDEIRDGLLKEQP